MDLQVIKSEIETQLAAREKRVVNRNAISALFGAFSDPAGALGEIFLGRADAIDAERQRITQDLTLELLCKIDEAISQTSRSGIELSGLIEMSAESVEQAIGVHITPDAGQVVFKPGTHIKTTFANVRSGTGLKIGPAKE